MTRVQPACSFDIDSLKGLNALLQDVYEGLSLTPVPSPTPSVILSGHSTRLHHGSDSHAHLTEFLSPLSTLVLLPCLNCLNSYGKWQRMQVNDLEAYLGVSVQ